MTKITQTEEAVSSARYFLSVARINIERMEEINFELVMRQSFKTAKVTDFDCVNITRKRFVVSVIEDGEIRLYSLSYDNAHLNTAEPLTYDLAPKYTSRRNNFCLTRLLPFAKKDLLVASDTSCNIQLFRVSSHADCLARPIHVIFNAHAKLISDLAFITVPVPQVKDQAVTQIDY